MHQFSLEYLRCVNCGSQLELDIYEKSDEVEEGFLSCLNCNHNYPVISKIPILWPDLAAYLSNRAQLGGYLLNQVKNAKLKSFVKDSLKKVSKHVEDVIPLEKRWVKTYKSSLRSKFYSYIKNSIKKLPKTNLVLEHGCSIGYVSNYLAQKHTVVFGIDQSFFAVYEAKKNNLKNLDYFVSNSLFHPFGEQKFGLVIGLNLLELIEPLEFLQKISSQTRGIVVISDPYDFERGKNSVKTRMDPISLRSELEKLGFTLIKNTKKPAFLPWKLRINDRLNLHYKVDLVIARNSK